MSIKKVTIDQVDNGYIVEYWNYRARSFVFTELAEALVCVARFMEPTTICEKICAAKSDLGKGFVKHS